MNHIVVSSVVSSSKMNARGQDSESHSGYWEAALASLVYYLQLSPLGRGEGDRVDFVCH